MNNNADMSESVIKTCGKFCQALTRDEVETFLRFTSIRDIEPKGVVAEVGDVGDEFFLVIEGEIRLSREEGSTDIEVGRIGPGGLVGEMSFFDKLPRTIRLRASKKGAKLVVITRPMYKRITIEHPFVAVNLLEFVILSLDKLVRSTSKDISSMHKTMSGVGYR
ncbi:MAG: cyclic nucleotide-binding domain-containing protein [Thiotrichaceae bacterium]